MASSVPDRRALDKATRAGSLMKYRGYWNTGNALAGLGAAQNMLREGRPMTHIPPTLGTTGAEIWQAWRARNRRVRLARQPASGFRARHRANERQEAGAASGRLTGPRASRRAWVQSRCVRDGEGFPARFPRVLKNNSRVPIFSVDTYENPSYVPFHRSRPA